MDYNLFGPNPKPKSPNQQKVEESYKRKKIVTLTDVKNINNQVRFEVVPRITESRSASFVNQGIPSSFPVIVYAVTNGRTYNVNGQMISRTREEADKNYKDMLMIKTWILPEEEETLDQSPARIYLHGWGTTFFKVAVSLQAYNFNFPDDVDYIQGNSGAYMPIVLSFSLTLIENQPEGMITDFSITGYRRGELMGY